MTKRVIAFTAYDNADPRVIAWIEASGLDPWLVAAAKPAIIEGGQLTFTEFVLEQTVPGAPPHKTLADDGDGYKKMRRTVPLLSAPENHGL